MTILCSPKVTQHQRQVNRPLPSGSAPFAAGQVKLRAGLASTGVLIGTRCRPTSRAPYAPPARMTERQNATPSAWMISLSPLLPSGKSCSSCGSLYPSTNGSFLPSAEGKADLVALMLLTRLAECLLSFELLTSRGCERDAAMPLVTLTELSLDLRYLETRPDQVGFIGAGP